MMKAVYTWVVINLSLLWLLNAAALPKQSQHNAITTLAASEALKPRHKQASRPEFLTFCSHSNALTARQARSNDSALVCDDDKFQTSQCQASGLEYYCDKTGQVKNKGEYTDEFCDETCECVNLNPRPYSFAGYQHTSWCLKRRDDEVGPEEGG